MMYTEPLLTDMYRYSFSSESPAEILLRIEKPSLLLYELLYVYALYIHVEQLVRVVAILVN